MAKALYSLPYAYRGRGLRARADSHTVRFYEGQKLVKTHPRLSPGQRSTDPHDLPPEKAIYAQRDTAALTARAAEHGEAVARFAKALLSLRQARLTNSYEAELRKLISTDLLILDDFCLDAMDQQESRDAYDVLTERQRAGSVIVTSNRGPDEWLATFADPLRAQSVIDRFVNAAYDLVIEGESYRPRLKPTRGRSSNGQTDRPQHP